MTDKNNDLSVSKRTPLGEFLYELRQEHGETMNDMARKLGRLTSQLWNIEYGHQCSWTFLLDAIMEEYDLDKDQCLALSMAAEKHNEMIIARRKILS